MYNYSNWTCNEKNLHSEKSLSSHRTRKIWVEIVIRPSHFLLWFRKLLTFMYYIRALSLLLINLLINDVKWMCHESELFLKSCELRKQHFLSTIHFSLWTVLFLNVASLYYFLLSKVGCGIFIFMKYLTGSTIFFISYRLPVSSQFFLDLFIKFSLFSFLYLKIVQVLTVTIVHLFFTTIFIVF